MTCGNDPYEKDENNCRNKSCGIVLNDDTSSRLSVKHGLCRQCFKFAVSDDPKKYLYEVAREIQLCVTVLKNYANIDSKWDIGDAAIRQKFDIIEDNINFIKLYLKKNVY